MTRRQKYYCLDGDAIKPTPRSLKNSPFQILPKLCVLPQPRRPTGRQPMPGACTRGRPRTAWVDNVKTLHGRPLAWTKKGHCPPPSPSVNVVKCFCALVVTAKRSVDKLFMHYFHILVALPQTPTGIHPWTPLRDFRPRPLICSPLEKIPRATMTHGQDFS